MWEIDQSCFPPGVSYTRFELASYIQRTKAVTLVAEEQELDFALKAALDAGTEGTKGQFPPEPAILGFIVAERVQGSGHIITIDVRSEGRRAGVGSELLHRAEEHLRLWNCRVVRLETAVDNVAALSFYKRHRYSVIRVVPRYYSNGLDALLLEKDLLSPHRSR